MGSRLQIGASLCGGVLHFELLEDGGAVVGNGEVTDIVDKHL